jgi:hypothetical protein
MKLILIVLFALFPVAALPQQTDVQPADVTKIVRIKYGVAQKITDLVAPGIPVRFTADNYSNVIVLKGNPKAVASAEQTIRELDVPGAETTSRKSKDVELVIYAISGSDKTELPSGSQPPEIIAPVIRQLRAAFPYKSYQLLSSMLLRSSEGASAGSRGNLAGLGMPSYPSQYLIEYKEANVSTGEGRLAIHLRSFKFETSVAVPAGTLPNTPQFQTMSINIQTDVDLREGQKVVVGKANVGSSDLALFVVLTARLVD